MITILFSILVYFTPTLIAAYRNHNDWAVIFILNLFLGWTVVAWIFALIWSLMNPK